MIVAGLLLTRIDLEPLGAQRLARLRARVVELARLADHDRAGADDQDALQIGATGHFQAQGSSWLRPASSHRAVSL